MHPELWVDEPVDQVERLVGRVLRRVALPPGRVQPRLGLVVGEEAEVHRGDPGHVGEGGVVGAGAEEAHGGVGGGLDLALALYKRGATIPEPYFFERIVSSCVFVKEYIFYKQLIAL